MAAISSFFGSSLPRDWTRVSSVSCIGRWTLYLWATWEPTMRLLISIYLFVFCTKFSEAWSDKVFFWEVFWVLRAPTKKGHIQTKWGAWYFSDFPIRIKMPTKCAWGSSVSVGPESFPFFLCVQTLDKASKLLFKLKNKNKNNKKLSKSWRFRELTYCFKKSELEIKSHFLSFFF